MFDRVAGPLRRAQLGDDGGAAPPLAGAGGGPRRAGAGGHRPRRLLRHRRPGAGAGPPRRARTAAWSAATSPSRCSIWRARRRRRAARGGARFEWADALQLPYDAGRFDAVTVGFGVRNLADLDRGLREMARVLRPGGGWSSSRSPSRSRPPLSTFYSLWFDRVVAAARQPLRRPGGLRLPARIGPQLPRPARPGGEDGRAAGLERIRYTVLAGGIIAIHSGVRE